MMKFTVHFLSSIALAGVLFPFVGLVPAALVFLGGWTVDLDHYLWYIIKYKKFGMAECNRFFTVDSRTNNSRHFRGSFMPAHTIEFIVLMAFLSFYSKYAMYYSIGLALHFLLDFLSFLLIEKDFPLVHSIIYWTIRKNIKNFKAANHARKFKNFK